MIQKGLIEEIGLGTEYSGQWDLYLISWSKSTGEFLVKFSPKFFEPDSLSVKVIIDDKIMTYKEAAILYIQQRLANVARTGNYE